MGNGFKIMIGLGILLVFFLVIGQTLSLFDHELAITLGLQESEEEIGSIGTVFAKGFAFGDTIFYIPLLILGIIGLLKRKRWGFYFMFASMAITVYWPIVHLYTIYIGRNVFALHRDKYISFPITLSLILIYGLWVMWYLYHDQKEFIK